MKKRILIQFVVLLSFLFLFSTSGYGINVPVGEETPGFSLMSINGELVSLDEYRGKIVVVVYWKPGQKRSLIEMDDLYDLSGKYKKKGVEVISIIPEAEDYQNVRDIISDKKIDFPVLKDKDRKIFGSYEIRVYPSTVIVNREGRTAYVIPGHPLTYMLTTEGFLRYMLGEINEEELNEILSPTKKVVDKAAVIAERKYNLALNFAESGLMELAAMTAKGSLKAKDDFAKSHILLGFLYLEMDESDNAVMDFKKALELTPMSKDAMTGLGAALIRKDDINGAIEVLSKAVQLNPYPQRTYYELGKAYELKGEKEMAMKLYRKAFEKASKKNLLPSKIFKCK